MKGKDTLENVISLVHEISENHYDETVPLKDMEFESLDKIWIDGRSFEVQPNAGKLLSGRLGVPYSYMKKCDSALQKINLDHWLKREAEYRDTFFCRFNENSLRGVFTQKYRPLDNLTALSLLIEHGFDPLAEVQYAIDDSLFVIKIPEFARSFNINPGYGELDEIVPGISLLNSEIGIAAFCIEAYFYRLICTNCAIVKTSSTVSKFKHISNRGLECFPETLAGVIEGSIRQQEQFMISRNIRVEDPISSIENFSKQFGLSQSLAEIVFASFYNEAGSTIFSVINAFTAAAKNPNLSIEESYNLERSGGRILEMVKA